MGINLFSGPTLPDDSFFYLNLLNPMNNRNFSTVLASIVIGFFSIYAAASNQFLTSNNTSSSVNVTLQLQSGGHAVVNVAPLSSIPTAIGGDQVVGLTIFGAYDPAGANAIIPNPSGGTVSVTWQTAGGGQPTGGAVIDPNELGA